ncbi:MAG: DUF2341 domain-containing protein [Kofleriaceae bacterium]
MTRWMVLAATVALGGCRTLLGIEDGVVGTAKADAAPDMAIEDADIDAPIDAAMPWWDPSFPSRRSITIATADLTLPLANLPLLVRLPADVASELRAGAADARFIADDHQTVLPYELETAGTDLRFWVKLSVTAQDQRIWLYFGNMNASSPSNGAAVFGADYTSVHHLSSEVDSSGNGHNVNAPGTSAPIATDTIIGRGFDFDGLNDYLALDASDGPYDFTTTMSVSVWFKTSAFTEDYQALVTKGDTSWRVQRDFDTNRVTFATGALGSTDNVVGTSNVANNEWHHLLVTRDNGAKSLYLDGVLENTRANPPALPANGSFVRIGANEMIAGRTWNGVIDEVRISSAPRTAAWAAAEYAMVTKPTLVTIGARETLPP